MVLSIEVYMFILIYLMPFQSCFLLPSYSIANESTANPSEVVQASLIESLLIQMLIISLQKLWNKVSYLNMTWKV